MKIGDKIRAVKDIQLHKIVIPKGTIGEVVDHLKDSSVYQNGGTMELLPLKFPNVKAFYGTEEEVELL